MALYLYLKTIFSSFFCFLIERKFRKTVSAGKRNSPLCVK